MGIFPNGIRLACTGSAMLSSTRLFLAGVTGFVLSAGMSTSGYLHAQPAPALLTDPVWEIRTAPEMDLWYHGLAVIGFQGFGPLPMYDAQYASMVRAEKIKRASRPSLLDRNAALLRTAFSRDSTFEVMHFLPLYFLAPGSGSVLSGLQAVARGDMRERINAGAPDAAVLTAVAGIIRTSRQRELLALFIQGLEDERRAFYEDFERRTRESRRISREAFSAFWKDSLLPSMTPFLKNVDAAGGTIILSPALGGEGRSIRIPSTPGGPTSTIVAVGTGSGETDYRTPAVSLVRELCFQIVHDVIGPARSASTSRVSAERLSSVAAIRCGAQALEIHRPSLVASYKLRFLAAAERPIPRANLDSAFLSAFPISGAIDTSLRRALIVH